MARQCDARFEEITAEDFGSELVAMNAPDVDARARSPYPATPACTPTANQNRHSSHDCGSGLGDLLW